MNGPAPASPLPYQFEFSRQSQVPRDIRPFIARLMPVFQQLYPFPWQYHKSNTIDHFEWETWGQEEFQLPENHQPHISLQRETIGEIAVCDEIEISYFECRGFTPEALSPYRMSHHLTLNIECRGLHVGDNVGYRECKVFLASDDEFVFDRLKRRIEYTISKYEPKDPT